MLLSYNFILIKSYSFILILHYNFSSRWNMSFCELAYSECSQCLSEKMFISISIVKITFSGCVILGWELFIFSTWILFHFYSSFCCYWWQISFQSLLMISYFSLAPFKCFSLYLMFCSFILYLGMDSFNFWSLRIYVFQSFMGMVCYFVFETLFSPIFLVFSSGTLIR